MNEQIGLRMSQEHTRDGPESDFFSLDIERPLHWVRHKFYLLKEDYQRVTMKNRRNLSLSNEEIYTLLRSARGERGTTGIAVSVRLSNECLC